MLATQAAEGPRRCITQFCLIQLRAKRVISKYVSKDATAGPSTHSLLHREAATFKSGRTHLSTHESFRNGPTIISKVASSSYALIRQQSQLQNSMLVKLYFSFAVRTHSFEPILRIAQFWTELV